MEEVKITSKFITLAQFLKFVDIVPSGGIVKLFLADGNVKVNGEIETRRGRKLYPSDIISVIDGGSFKLLANENWTNRFKAI